MEKYVHPMRLLCIDSAIMLSVLILIWLTGLCNAAHYLAGVNEDSQEIIPFAYRCALIQFIFWGNMSLAIIYSYRYAIGAFSFKSAGFGEKLWLIAAIVIPTSPLVGAVVTFLSPIQEVAFLLMMFIILMLQAFILIMLLLALAYLIRGIAHFVSGNPACYFAWPNWLAVIVLVSSLALPALHVDFSLDIPDL
ncbi:MAG: hypothetical protein ACRC3H_19250 [Lachnospiraceae bacterium]